MDANQTPQPLNRVKKSKKGLLDFNRDGTINLRDAFRLAGLRGRLDRVAGMTSDGRLAFRDPKKLLGDALIDFLEDGKIRVTPSSELIGVDIARFNGSSKISYSHKHKRLTLYKTWVFK
ncbi:MAG: hypothetical protein KY468_08820 [Armatimonadetes bacterium]|nr:hypothetical protein [Armatimonadota bacterium]